MHDEKTRERYRAQLAIRNARGELATATEDDEDRGRRVSRPISPTSAVVAAVFFVVGAVLTLSLALHLDHYRSPVAATTPTPSVPPMGWTEVCHPAALADVCQTYPPGDPRSEPTPPPCVLKNLPPEIPCRP